MARKPVRIRAALGIETECGAQEFVVRLNHVVEDVVDVLHHQRVGLVLIGDVVQRHAVAERAAGELCRRIDVTEQIRIRLVAFDQRLLQLRRHLVDCGRDALIKLLEVRDVVPRRIDLLDRELVQSKPRMRAAIDRPARDGLLGIEYLLRIRLGDEQLAQEKAPLRALVAAIVDVAVLQ